MAIMMSLDPQPKILVAIHVAAEPVCNYSQPSEACQASMSPRSKTPLMHPQFRLGYQVDGLVLAIDSAARASFNAMAQWVQCVPPWQYTT